MTKGKSNQEPDEVKVSSPVLNGREKGQPFSRPLTSEHDPVGEHCLNQPIEDLAWSFALGGDKIFVNTFAPFYPEGHSRYGFGSSSTWIMFQPRHSFGRVAKIGETALPPHIRLRIREDHASHNRAYDPKLSAIPYEAYRCIRPLYLGDSEVRWWETTL